MTGLYSTLNIPRDSSPDTIRKAYRRMSKKHHPDHNPGDESAATAYNTIDLAYRILSDPDRKAKYDATGEIDVPKPDRELTELMGTLVPVLMSVIAQPIREVTLTTWPDLEVKTIGGTTYRDEMLATLHGRWPGITFTLPPEPAQVEPAEGHFSVFALLTT